MTIKIVVWVLTMVAAFRLWGSATWLSVIVFILALGYAASPDEQRHHDLTGAYSNSTGTRLMLTFVAVLVIFTYSLFA